MLSWQNVFSYYRMCSLTVECVLRCSAGKWLAGGHGLCCHGLRFFRSLSLSLCLAFSLSRTCARARARARCLSRAVSLARSLSLCVCLSRVLALSLCLSRSLSRALSLLCICMYVCYMYVWDDVTRAALLDMYMYICIYVYMMIV